MEILSKLNRKWPLSILILFIFAALTSCSEQNDLKNAKVGSSQSDVDSSGGDSGDSGALGMHIFLKELVFLELRERSERSELHAPPKGGGARSAPPER